MEYSNEETLVENAFISGVCTNTPNTFTPTTEQPNIVAGYWNRSGLVKKPRAMAEVATRVVTTTTVLFTLELQSLKMCNMITSWRKKNPGRAVKR